jgi:hypothetical protein
MSIIRLSDTTLKSSEREEKDAQELLRSHRKPRPSRKHKKGRAAPRESQQKSRVNVHDSDIDKSDPDLSLGKRFNASDIALRMVFSAEKIPEGLKPSLQELLKSLDSGSKKIREAFQEQYEWARND